MIARTRVVGHSRVEEAADRVLQQDLVFDSPKSMMTVPGVRRYLRASRGRPRPRSAMMLRWMLAAPPAIRMPSDHMYADAEHAHGGRVRLAGREQAAVAHDVHRELRDVVAELRAVELRHHAGQARVLAARAAR